MWMLYLLVRRDDINRRPCDGWMLERKKGQMEGNRAIYLNEEEGCQIRWSQGRAVSSACMSYLLTRRMIGHGSYLRANIREMFSFSREDTVRLEEVARPEDCKAVNGGRRKRRSHVVQLLTPSRKPILNEWP